jgi:hypothetical protein
LSPRARTGPQTTTYWGYLSEVDTHLAPNAFRVQNGIIKGEVLGGWLKRLALLFDRIAIYDLAPALSQMEDSRLAEELRWLLTKEVICQPEVEDREYENVTEEYQALSRAAVHELSETILSISNSLEKFEAEQPDEKAILREVADSLELATWAQTRSAALWFRAVDGTAVIPVIERIPQPMSNSDPGVPTVQIMIKAFPVLDDSTRWEDVIEFRSAPENRRALAALRNWANETARLRLQPHEILDKLETLLSQYQSQLELNRLKFKLGTMEVIVTATAGVVEELINLNFGKAVKAALEFKQRRVELLQAEINAPGSELAYIVRASTL